MDKRTSRLADSGGPSAPAGTALSFRRMVDPARAIATVASHHPASNPTASGRNSPGVVWRGGWVVGCTSPVMAIKNASLGARYRAAARASSGGCPIEAGLLGLLADHECRHGRLPFDRTPPCGCWPEEGAGVLTVPPGARRPAGSRAGVKRLRAAGGAGHDHRAVPVGVLAVSKWRSVVVCAAMLAGLVGDRSPQGAQAFRWLSALSDWNAWAAGGGTDRGRGSVQGLVGQRLGTFVGFNAAEGSSQSS